MKKLIIWLIFSFNFYISIFSQSANNLANNNVENVVNSGLQELSKKQVKKNLRLIERNKKLIDAVSCGKPIVIDRLIKNGVDVNTVDSEGTPVLHLAIEALRNAKNKKLRAKIIGNLINHGANVNSFDARGRTPLDYLEFSIHSGARWIYDQLKKERDENMGLIADQLLSRGARHSKNWQDAVSGSTNR